MTDVTYTNLKEEIKTRLNLSAKNFFLIGYYLRQIADQRSYENDGYKDVWEFAKKEYGLSLSSASRFININKRFCLEDNPAEMDQRYKGLGVSKLQEMLTLTDEQLNEVTEDTTVREIREMKKAAVKELSFYGEEKTVRPEGSLLTTPGCGSGKHDCFSCSQVCGIRQEERLCIVSTIGAGKRCPNTTNDFMENIKAGMYREDCQFLHPENAEVRRGDGEPTPCCLKCGFKGLCFSSCDVAKAEHKKMVEESKKQMQKQIAKEEKKKPEPGQKDFEALYKSWSRELEKRENYETEHLRDKFCHRGTRTNLLKMEASRRGVTINNKQELTWNRISKELLKIYDAEHAEEKQAVDAEVFDAAEQEPDVIDAEFCEITDADPEEPEPERTEPELERKHGYNLNYSIQDVQDLLEKQNKELAEYLKCEGLPQKLVRSQYIIVEALKELLSGGFGLEVEQE